MPRIRYKVPGARLPWPHCAGNRHLALLQRPPCSLNTPAPASPALGQNSLVTSYCCPLDLSLSQRGPMGLLSLFLCIKGHSFFSVTFPPPGSIILSPPTSLCLPGVFRTQMTTLVFFLRSLFFSVFSHFKHVIFLY